MKRLESLKTPAFIQRLQWIFDPVGYMEKAHQDHPEMFVAKVTGFGNTIIYVSNPQAMQYILTNDRKILTAPSDLNRILQPFLGDNSMIMIEGESHKKRRQLVMPSFHGDRLRNYGELICQLTTEIMDKLPIDQVFLARTTTQSVSLQVIFDVVFGLQTGERAEQIRELLTVTADMFRSPLTSALLFFPALQKDLGAWSPWGKFLRQRQKLDNLIYAELSDRRANFDANRTDILSLMMAAKDEEGNPMSDEELRDELMTLLFAGHETTASAMAWALYWVHHLPEIKDKLLTELATLGNSPEPTEIARLPYLNAVCQETLRLSPVAMLTFPRVVQEPIELLGYSFQPGDIFMGCMYLTHLREDLYPNPKEFKPERFLERKFSPYEFIPFGNGARRCVGEALAQYEMKLVLATILSGYHLELADKQPEKQQRRGVTLAPARGVRMVMKGLRPRQEKSAELVESSL